MAHTSLSSKDACIALAAQHISLLHLLGHTPKELHASTRHRCAAERRPRLHRAATV